MPSLLELLGNDPTFNYRTGVGNFIADKLPFGQDLEGGGTSKQPYIKHDRDHKYSPSNFDDGVVPFGFVTKVNSTAEDVVRITDFLTDDPKGPLFLAKQAGLQLTNVKLESKADGKTDLSTLSNRLFSSIGDTRIFNPLGTNLLAQTAANLVGGHVNRHGLLPISSKENSYEEIVKFNNNNLSKSDKIEDYKNNRLIDLFNKLTNVDRSKAIAVGDPMITYSGGPDSLLGIGSTSIRRVVDSIDRKLDNNDEPSVYYINDDSKNNKLKNTFDEFLQLSTGAKLEIEPEGLLFSHTGNKTVNNTVILSDIEDTPNFYLRDNPSNSPQIIPLSDIVRIGDANSGVNNVTHIIGATNTNTLRKNFQTGSISFDFSTEDFREYKNILSDNGKKGGSRLASTDYKSLNLVKRIGIVQTRPENDRYDYTSTGSLNGEYADRINMLSLFKSSNALDQESLNKGNGGNGIVDINGRRVLGASSDNSNLRDIIKFRIKAIDNDKYTQGVFMVFRAYLTDFSDKSDKKLSSYNYLGRAENFYVEDGYSNTFSIGFMVAASSRAEMKPLYQKMNYLKSTLAPDYKGQKMRSSMVEMTIGDYIYQQPGFITSLNITVENDFNWEIAMSEPDAAGVNKDRDMHELPMMLRVSMTFIPIWDFMPRRSAELPFISIGDKEAVGNTIKATNDAKEKSRNHGGKEWLWKSNDKLNIKG